MKTRLIIVTDANHARVFSDNGNSHVELLNELDHPENRLKVSELLDDRSGHFKTDGSSHGAYSKHTSPKEIIKNKFAIKVADLIESEMNSKGCHNLVLIAEPDFYGFLKKHLSKPVEQSLGLVIKKNPVGIETNALKGFILENRFAA